MNEPTNNIVDPDPFLIAGLCFQGAAVILQLVQIAQHHKGSQTSTGALGQRNQTLEKIEDHLENFDKAIARTEKFVRRNSDAPEREMYDVSFRISLGVLKFTARNTQEYHDNIAEVSANLANLTRWIGHLIGQDPDLAAELGENIVNTVQNSAERLNQLMANGGSIEAVLSEAKLVRDACKTAITRRLNDRSN